MATNIEIRALDKRDLAAFVNMEETRTGVLGPFIWEKPLKIPEAVWPHWHRTHAQHLRIFVFMVELNGAPITVRLARLLFHHNKSGSGFA